LAAPYKCSSLTLDFSLSKSDALFALCSFAHSTVLENPTFFFYVGDVIGVGSIRSLGSGQRGANVEKATSSASNHGETR